jgi:long-chain acyl-CoA synthetase
MGSGFLHDWVFHHAHRNPARLAIATADSRLTYGELADRVRSLAGHLAQSGVQQGDRVLLALPNVPATVVAGLALNALGAVSVEANRGWGTVTLAGIVEGAHIRHAFVSRREAAAWGAGSAPRGLERLWVIGNVPLRSDGVSAASIAVTYVDEQGRVQDGVEDVDVPSFPSTQPDATALILYTSGSTGMPHGVVQTVGNVLANTESIVEYLHLTSNDRALVTLPLYYCYGRSVLQTHLYVGGSLFLSDGFTFPRLVLEALALEECTGFPGVPMTFEILRRQVDVESMKFPSLRYVTQAGGAMTPSTTDWVRRVFAPADLFVMYGQTEATARLSYLPPDRAASKSTSIGIPIPGVELRVVDQGGQELPIGETGELIARGGNITPGYLDDPEATSAILRDGWLWTGDQAHRDADGFFYHRGRTKEIIKVAGHRVSPAEIEAVLMTHGELIEAAVIGVDDPLKGEVAIAFVVSRSNPGPPTSELMELCRARLVAYKVPAAFVPIDRLPRNEAGKVLRPELLAMYQGKPGSVIGPTGRRV